MFIESRGEGIASQPLPRRCIVAAAPTLFFSKTAE